jgi:hypothetical protein
VVVIGNALVGFSVMLTPKEKGGRIIFSVGRRGPGIQADGWAELEEARGIWTIFLALRRLKYGYRTTKDNKIGIRGVLETTKSIDGVLEGAQRLDQHHVIQMLHVTRFRCKSYF